ncbi:DinB family protein [Paenibacillus whitsoniae]|uniref:DinB family protein n=1 Tax=Paenibacillus whitsoniae TaxID=2496558 RepID=A0A3S0AD31_9BACL|nr:DinB family protein [Paenibacillus whitsoniae]RTE10148.1 DinB family protein [Paenibacillus whitsoniae]
MSITIPDFSAYLHTHAQLQEAIAGISEEQLTWKPRSDQWSLTEVLSHLADHNLVVSFRIRAILAGATAQLPAFDQDAWVSGAKANGGSASDILAAFQALLIYNTSLFQRLSAEDWAKTGVNFKGQTLTLADVVHSFIAHVQHHLGQLERIKNVLKARV